MDNRTRNWASILYPAELPQNYIQRLQGLNIPFFLSPVHNPDCNNINPEEQRKIHQHIEFAFDGVKSCEQVTNLFFEVFKNHNGWVRPIPVNSPKAMIRYFIHADQPEKQQFEERFLAIKCFNGANLDNVIIPSSSEKSLYTSQMIDYCMENNIFEISDLILVSKEEHFDTWYWVLQNTSLSFLSKFLDSQRNKTKVNVQKQLQLLESQRKLFDREMTARETEFAKAVYDFKKAGGQFE